MYCRAAALDAGHPPAEIDEMPFRDLELLASYATGRANSQMGVRTE